MEKFYAALYAKLIADTGVGSLVTLTGHLATEMHIGMRSPELIERYDLQEDWVY